jgi:hypothetical protein
VYASKGKWKNYWEIKSVVDHTCVLKQLDASHRNLSSGFVASQIFAKIVENSTMSLSPLSWQLRRNLGTR